MVFISEKIQGIVQRVIYPNPVTGWSVQRLQYYNNLGEQLTVTVNQTKIFAVHGHDRAVLHPGWNGGNKPMEKRRQIPADDQVFAMEVCFILLLHGVSLSGLVLLAFRDTGAMGTLLIIHLGLVTGFFITMPYSKFIHALYRYTALIRFAQENSDSDSAKT